MESLAVHTVPRRQARTILSGSAPAKAERSPHDKLDDRQLAEEYGISRRTLQNWRSAGKGPPYLKLGSRVLYQRAAVEMWAEAHRITPGA